MSLFALGWLFTLGVLVHNVEEALLLPAWSAGAGRWYPPVGALEFRFAAVVLSLSLIVLAVAAPSAGSMSFVAYVFTGYAFAMVANVLLPASLASPA